ILPNHRRWGDFLHRLAFVVVDECHMARGVFGAHVAAILRRLRRICDRYSADPVFILASATIGNAAEHAANLIGDPVHAVTTDGSGRPPVTLGLWEPPLMDTESGARRSPLAETADVLAACVRNHTRTLAFVRSRKGSEVVATSAARVVTD